MTYAEIEECFTSLKGRFEVTSPPDEEYNCIAWTLNDKKQWWWPTPSGQGRWPGKYWPPGVLHEETLSAFTALYKEFRFEICTGVEFETGFDKIAIFVDSGGSVTHAARWWYEDRGWSSKLGEENDIRHHTLESLEGHSYGKVVQIMKRARRPRVR